MANEFDLISALSSLFQPAEAEAAAAPQIDPTQQLFRQLQMANQLRRTQMTDQTNQLRERELKLREQKSTPQQPQNLQAQLATILGGGNQQDPSFGIPDLDIRGTEGGVPFFSNWRASREAPQEEQQQVSKLYQERQGKIAAARGAQSKRDGIDEQTLAQASQLSTMLNAAKVPNETISLILRNTFPGIGEAKRAEAVKPIPADKLGNFYNKQTGAPASEEFADREPDQETLKRNYILLDAKAKERYGNLQQLDNTITQYDRLGGTLGLPAEPGIMGRAGGVAKMKMNRLGGGIESADLDSINSQITSLARAFGGDSRVSDKEMSLLRAAVINDGDNQQAVTAKINNLKRFRDAVSKLVPIPGIQGKYAGEEAAAQPKQGAQPKGAPATQRGIPPGRVPMINPQGKPVTLPAAQVSEALKAGYQPYGAR